LDARVGGGFDLVGRHTLLVALEVVKLRVHVIDLDAFLLALNVLLLLRYRILHADPLLHHQRVEGLLRFRDRLLVVDLVLATTLDDARLSFKIEFLLRD
jgi:hypothetical protein